MPDDEIPQYAPRYQPEPEYEYQPAPEDDLSESILLRRMTIPKMPARPEREEPFVWSPRAAVADNSHRSKVPPMQPHDLLAVIRERQREAEYIFGNRQNKAPKSVLAYFEMVTGLLGLGLSLNQGQLRALETSVVELDFSSGTLARDVITRILQSEYVAHMENDFSLPKVALDSIRAKIRQGLVRALPDDFPAELLEPPYANLRSRLLRSTSRIRVYVAEASRREVADASRREREPDEYHVALENVALVLDEFYVVANSHFKEHVVAGRSLSLDRFDSLFSAAYVVWRESDLDGVERFFCEELIHVLQPLIEMLVDAGEEELARKWSGILEDLHLHASHSGTAAIQANVAESERLLAEQRQAVSGTGDRRLAEFYERIAMAEEATANNFRKATIALLTLALLGAGALVTLSLKLGEDQVSTSLGRLFYEIPLVLLALYLARQEVTHRARSRVSEEFSARLNTLKTFSESLDVAGKNQIRIAVGTSILVGPPALSAVKNREPIELEDITKIVDLIETRRPSEQGGQLSD